MDLAAALELGDDIGGGLDRDREADALVAAALALDLRVDADHLAGAVDQRPAGVAGVDRRVGLDHVADREAVGGLDLALERRDDARSSRCGRGRTGCRSRRPGRRPAPSMESPSGSGLAPSVLSTLSSATSVEGSVPDDLGVLRRRRRRAGRRRVFAPSTTWALVRMCPSLSIRKPEPVASLCCCCGRPKTDCVFCTICERMKATPCAVALVDVVDGEALARVRWPGVRARPAQSRRPRTSRRPCRRPRPGSGSGRRPARRAARDGGSEAGREESLQRTARGASVRTRRLTVSKPVLPVR